MRIEAAVIDLMPVRLQPIIVGMTWPPWKTTIAKGTRTGRPRVHQPALQWEATSQQMLGHINVTHGRASVGIAATQNILPKTAQPSADLMQKAPRILVIVKVQRRAKQRAVESAPVQTNPVRHGLLHHGSRPGVRRVLTQRQHQMIQSVETMMSSSKHGSAPIVVETCRCVSLGRGRVRCKVIGRSFSLYPAFKC